MTCAITVAYFMADWFGLWLLVPVIVWLCTVAWYECRYHYGLTHDRQLQGLYDQPIDWKKWPLRGDDG